MQLSAPTARRWARIRHGCSPGEIRRSACRMRAALRRWGCLEQNSGCWPPCSGSQPAPAGAGSASGKFVLPQQKELTKRFYIAEGKSKSTFPLCAKKALENGLTALRRQRCGYTPDDIQLYLDRIARGANGSMWLCSICEKRSRHRPLRAADRSLLRLEAGRRIMRKRKNW